MRAWHPENGQLFIKNASHIGYPGLIHGQKCATKKRNEKSTVLDDGEMKRKPATKDNQFVLWNFRRFQFVSFEVSPNITHDEKMIPNRSQNNPVKSNKKSFTESETPGFNDKKHWKSVKKKTFKRIQNSWKNCGKQIIVCNMFPMQTKMAVCEKRHMSISVLNFF